jgi:hypothetical protein
MVTRSVRADGMEREGYIPSKETLDVQAKQTPKIIYAAACILLCLTTLVLGVMGVARMGTIPQILDPPPEYLPGSPKPRDLSCYTPSDEVISRCFVRYLGREIYLDFDVDTRTIYYAIMPVGGYTIGSLMVSWGAPTGMTWSDYTIHIYWGMRVATLYAHSIRPDSRVDFILYDLEQQPSSPWRGFRHHKY